MRIVLDLQGAQTASRTRGIGRYTTAFATALVRNRGEDEIILALNGLFPETIEPIREAFRGLLPRDHIRVWEAPGPIAAGAGNEPRRRRAELIYEAFLASLNPDVIHLSSLFEGFLDDAVTSIGALGTSVPTSVLLHDLIPLHHPELFLEPDAAAAAYYAQKLAYLSRADLILTNSDFTARDALERLPLDGTSVVAVSAACAPSFRPLAADEPGIAALRRRLRLAGPFLLTTGTIEPHKNLQRLFAAIARIAPERRIPVVLPGNFIGRQKQILGQMASSAGLGREEFVLAGYVSDDDLVRLYNCCDLMVLPSLDEGFGLPALEAIACGAPTIGSNAASIPEIIDREDALFDATDVDDMTRLISRGISDPAFRRSLRDTGLERARLFSWDETARRALSAMAATVEAKRQTRATARAAPPAIPRGRRMSLALVVPGPEGANHAAAFAERYDLTLVSPRPIVPTGRQSAFRVESPEWLHGNAAGIDRVVYVLGDTPAHDFMIPLIEALPGAVILDSLHIGQVFARREVANEDEAPWCVALYESHGYAAVRDRFRDAEAARRAYPASLDLLRKARGVIVHAPEMLAAGRDWLGPTVGRDWHLVPRGVADAGARYEAAIEASYAAGLAGLAEAIVALDLPRSDADVVALASTIAKSFPPARPVRQLLLDVSHTASTDIRTGIQRVVRALVLALLDAPPEGYRVEPVYLSPNGLGWRYRYARRFTLGLLGCPDTPLDDDLAEPAAGDVLFVLDLSGIHLIEANDTGLLADLRRRGLTTYATIYDILPVLLPHRFPRGTQGGFERWLEATAATDGVICISAAVAEDYRRWVSEKVPARSERLLTGWFHLGADIDNSAPTRGLPADAGHVLAALAQRPTFLTVGTIEPRKGHLQAIRAFERLWAAGTEANLVIVGAQGWTTLPDELRSIIPEIVATLRTHPERNLRLFWLEGISDEYLEQIYAAATCLLAASEGEGFGLPLIEAARHKVPILARDLPIFREVAGSHAAYFEAATDSELAAAIDGWLAPPPHGGHRRAYGSPGSPWRHSAAQLVRFLEAAEGREAQLPGGPSPDDRAKTDQVGTDHVGADNPAQA